MTGEKSVVIVSPEIVTKDQYADTAAKGVYALSKTLIAMGVPKKMVAKAFRVMSREILAEPAGS